jgi:hypothetical protein
MCDHNEFPDHMTLGEAREILAKKLFDGEEIICPTCTQKCKVYPRKINKTMAKTLVTMFLAGAIHHFVHTPSLDGDTHEASQLSWWGLIEDEGSRRPDGGRAGYWKMTKKGEQFIQGQIQVPKLAQVYDGIVYGFDDNEMINIDDALGSPFDYKELMNEVIKI